MAFGLTRKRIFSALTIAVFVLGAFTFGFVSSLHLKSAVSGDLRKHLLPAGDAPLPVRAGVLAALRDFQEGYVKRDPKELDAFMNRLFSKNDDILVLGTNAGEWARGYPAVGEFIRRDWLNWGDFRFAVDDSIVWSSGDVAWMASIGALHKNGSDRPLRLSAILTRHGNRWLFRQLQFQWEHRNPSPADLLRPSTDLELVKWVLQLTRHMAQSAGKILQLASMRTPSDPSASILRTTSSRQTQLSRCLIFERGIRRRQDRFKLLNQSPYIGFLKHRDVATGDVMNLQSAARKSLPAQSRIPASAHRLLDVRSPHQRDLPWIELDGVALQSSFVSFLHLKIVKAGWQAPPQHTVTRAS